MDGKFDCKCRKCNGRRKLRRKQFLNEIHSMQFAKKTKAESNNQNFFLNKEKQHPYNIHSQNHKNTFDFTKNQLPLLRRSRRLLEKTKSFKSAPQISCLEELQVSKPATITSNLLSPFDITDTPQTSSPDLSLSHHELISTSKIFNGFNHTSVLNNFNERFREQVKIPVVQTALEKLRISITDKVREINSVLNGEVQPEPMNNPIKRKFCTSRMDDENCPNFPLLSPNRWIFKTPPKQRINVPVSSCNENLKPFIYEANDKTTNLYEFDKGIYKYVNVNKLSDQNVLIDSRFMHQVNKNPRVCNLRAEDVTLQCVSPNKAYWKFNSPQEKSRKDNPFMMCTERPKKKKCYLQSMFPVDTYKKVETNEEFNSSFSVLDEDGSDKNNIFKSMRY